MQVTYNLSNLRKLRENTIAGVCTLIHQTALPLLPSLEPYGTSQQTLAILNQHITDYKEIVPKTRAGIVTQTIFTSQIAELFKENDKILHRIDKLVNILQFKEPDFFNQYYKAREIVQTGSRALSLQGKITDQDEQPIPKVTITVETPKAVKATSTHLGNFQFKTIQGGVFPVTFQRHGYHPIREFIAFTQNSRIDLNITLKPIDLNQKHQSA